MIVVTLVSEESSVNRARFEDVCLKRTSYTKLFQHFNPKSQACELQHWLIEYVNGAEQLPQILSRSKHSVAFYCRRFTHLQRMAPTRFTGWVNIRF